VAAGRVPCTSYYLVSTSTAGAAGDDHDLDDYDWETLL